jgi:hypothetical protein
MGAFSNGKSKANDDKIDNDLTYLNFYILRDGEQSCLMNQNRMCDARVN